MATVNFSNGPSAVLDEGIDASATELVLTYKTNPPSNVNVSADGFPPAPFYALIAAEGSNKDEIVLVTAVTGGSYSRKYFTIVRAAEKISDGTQVAQAHGVSARISHVLTAAALDDAATDFMAYRYF